MMLNLKLHPILWFQLLDFMVLVLLQVLHLHHITLKDLKRPITGPTKLHACLQAPLLVLLLLKLRTVFGQKYVSSAQFDEFGTNIQFIMQTNYFKIKSLLLLSALQPINGILLGIMFEMLF